MIFYLGIAIALLSKNYPTVISKHERVEISLQLLQSL